MFRKKIWNTLMISACVYSMAVIPTAAEDEAVVINLSDSQILVDGEEISDEASEAVYVGAEIVYYKAGQDATYGAGNESDGHTEEEAAAQTVITITQPGTYRVTGSISKGQIAVDLGEESREDRSAVVNLILDNAEITCDVAPGIVVYNAYECGSDEEEDATKDVDTADAGFCLILADGSVNTVNGSHVAKIYKDGTTQEDVDAGEAKKKWKFDGTIDSLVSMNIDGEEAGNGKLQVIADNEGISSALHMTVNGGEIEIQASDDSINTSEDNVSVFTMNGGSLTCNSNLGAEGDGIDSNGWIVINGGTVIAGANEKSMDSGVDSDLGIYINGGTLLAGGNMYDEVAADSEQPFLVFSFSKQLSVDEIILVKDDEGIPVIAFSPMNTCQTVVYSSEELEDGDYTLYKVSSVEGNLEDGIYTNITAYTEEVQLEFGGSMMGFGGGPRPEGMKSGEVPEMPEGMEPGGAPERPEGMEAGEMPELPEGVEPGEAPERPEGMEAGEMPERPEGMHPGEADENVAKSNVFTVNGIRNLFAQISEISETTEES